MAEPSEPDVPAEAAPPPARYHLVLFAPPDTISAAAFDTFEEAAAAVTKSYQAAADSQFGASARAFVFRGDRLSLAGDPDRYLVDADGRRLPVSPPRPEVEPAGAADDHLLPPSARL